MKSFRPAILRSAFAHRRALWSRALLAVVLAVCLGAPFARAALIHPPIGPYVNLTSNDFAGSVSFSATNRVVLTPYFYWYDVYSSAHITNPDGSDALTDHPPTLTGFSYRSSTWHRTQLLDMTDAGIDVALPVYWGEPSQRLPGVPIGAQPWSFAGLPPLVQARAQLLQEGQSPPRIGLFYDTSTLEFNAAGRRIDLTTADGRQWFYETIRDFFSLIPPQHWAMIDGQPVIFLYAASFAAAHDQSCIDFTRTAFARDFGGRVPFIVREISWQVRTENVYAWGGALGLKNPGVASLGPGYDHSAVPGRTPLVLSREDGDFFARNWTRFLRAPSLLVMIETWNEFHEGTEIAASREYGRQYIDLNRHYVDLFRRGVKPPRPRGPFSDTASVTVALDATNRTHGLFQLEGGDGLSRPAVVDGQPCRAAVPSVHAGRYLYFRIDDSYKWADRMLVDVDVEYHDAGVGRFALEFDGSDTNAPFQGAYTASRTSVTLTGTPQWRTARFRLTEARFLNSQNSGADFRLAVRADPFHVRRVTVTRLGLPAEAGATRRAWPQEFTSSLDPAWRITPTDVPRPVPVGGLLRLDPAQAGPAPFLLLTDRAAHVPTVELLARILVVNREPNRTAAGRLVLGAEPDAGVARSGLECVLGRDAEDRGFLELRQRGGPPGPRFSVAWDANQWYWLRLRYHTNAITSYPDLWARLWPADGETAEPTTWSAWWDCYPVQALALGRAGWAYVPDGLPFECDFFLLKSEGLAETSVLLPPRKPTHARLTPIGLTPLGFNLAIQGDTEVSQLLERSTDLRAWEEAAVIETPTGSAPFRDESAIAVPQRFYRARTGWRHE